MRGRGARAIGPSFAASSRLLKEFVATFRRIPKPAEVTDLNAHSTVRSSVRPVVNKSFDEQTELSLARARFLCPLPYPTAPLPSPAPLSAPPPRSRGSSPCTRRTRSPPPPAASSLPGAESPRPPRRPSDLRRRVPARRASDVRGGEGARDVLLRRRDDHARGGGVRMTSSSLPARIRSNPFEGRPKVRRGSSADAKQRRELLGGERDARRVGGVDDEHDRGDRGVFAFDREPPPVGSVERAAVTGDVDRGERDARGAEAEPRRRRRRGGRREERRGMMTMLVVVVRAIGGRTRRGPRAVRVRGLGGRPPAHARGRRG